MKFILFFFLFFSTFASAQRSLNQQAFQSNVRPMLNGILNDFYQMIVLFPDFPKDLVGLVQQTNNMNVDKEGLKLACPRLITSKCLSQVDSFRKLLAHLDAKTWELRAKFHPSVSPHLNSFGGLRLVVQFQTELEETKGLLNNASFLVRGQLPTHLSTYAVLKKLDDLNTLLSLAIVEFIPFPYREDFRHFYFNFVRPIDLHISKNKNYEFLNRNVNSLNFALNLLNMNLTKRNKKTPEGMAPFLALIHNRWNSILRYYF